MKKEEYNRFFVHPNKFTSLKDYHLHGYVDGLALNFKELPKAIEERVKFCIDKNLTFNSSSSRTDAQHTYKEACFADTFFSDTFPYLELSKLIHDAGLPAGNNERRSFRFLLLDPLCDLARLRAGTLNDVHPTSSDIRFCAGRLNLGLLRIKCALGRKIYDDERNNKNYTDKWTSLQWTGELLEEIDQISRRIDGLALEIKFTDEWIEMPLYIFGCYAFHGMISPVASAVQKPWIVYRDYMDIEHDLYSTLKNDFDAAWNKAQNISWTNMRQKLLDARRRTQTIFIAHGSNPAILDRVTTLVKSHHWMEGEFFTTINFDDRKSAGDNDRQAWTRCFDAASAAIVIITKEDYTVERWRQNSSGTDKKINASTPHRWMPRPNVMIELGYALAHFGEKRVLIVGEGDVAIPTNVPGEMAATFTIEGTDIRSRTLTERIHHFLDRVAGRPTSQYLPRF